MRSHPLGISLVVLAALTTPVGCGRGDADRPTDTALTPVAADSQNAPVPPPAEPVAPTAAADPSATPAGATGRVVDVQMLGDASGYRFVPATVTVKRGDRIRWTMVSGPPHNVAFWSDSIPAGAAATLGANMSKTTSPLSGPLMMAANETYEVSFAGVPVGTYRYFCTPHLALGMKGVVRVE